MRFLKANWVWVAVVVVVVVVMMRKGLLFKTSPGVIGGPIGGPDASLPISSAGTSQGDG